jgi:hypothetical protein
MERSSLHERKKAPTVEQLQAQIKEMAAEYQLLQDAYDDEVLLTNSVLRALALEDFAYCEMLVKQAECSMERKAHTLEYIAHVRDGYV